MSQSPSPARSANSSTRLDARTLFPGVPESEIRRLMRWRTGLEDPQPPLVSAILVIKDASRMRMAVNAIASFLNQNYQRKELVIVNATGHAFQGREHASVREVKADGLEHATLGEMRNIGIDEAAGEWLLAWDDDDYSHPDRILYQMAHRRDGAACLLSRQIRCSFLSSCAILHHNSLGIAATAIFPRTEARYPAMNVGEDMAILNAGYFRRQIVVDNVAPADRLSVAFYHGRNVLPAYTFMANRERPHRTELDDVTQSYLAETLLLYGAMASVRPMEEGARITETVGAVESP